MNFERLKKINASRNTIKLDIKPGQFLEIHEKVGEWNNKRIWKFKWLVIKVKKGNSPDGTFTIRWKTSGITIEKVYPLSFVSFDKVLLMDEYKIRRSKLYYIREKIGKDARMKSIIDQDKKWLDLLKLAQDIIEKESVQDIAVADAEELVNTVENPSEVEIPEDNTEETKETI
mgnify:CR=1 FL=1